MALAALEYLVCGQFLSPDAPESEEASVAGTGRVSAYNRVPSHVAREMFDKDELLRLLQRCDVLLDQAVSQCCTVHHIANPSKAFAVQIGAASGRKGAREHCLLAGLSLQVHGVNSTSTSSDSVPGSDSAEED